MTWQERILDDGTNREHWLISRRPAIGASDAKHLAKMSSVHLYLADKLKRDSFHGNAYTESGNRWEPMMLAWAGLPQNKAFIHSPAEVGFAATPDGITLNGNHLAECKAKHMRIVFGPDLGEWRQIAWQFQAVPEADELTWIWAELDAGGELRADLHGEPKSLTIKRGDPKVQKLLGQILPIAHELLPRLRAALEFERELQAS